MRRIPRPAAALAALAIAATLSACSNAPQEDPAPAHSYAQQPASDTSVQPAAAPTADAAEGDVPVAAANVAAPQAAPQATPQATPGTAPQGSPQAGARPAGTAAPARVAPRPTTDDGSRVLRIPAQGVAAAVFSCATENGVVTPPAMVKDVCWWTGSRPLDAAQGVSIVVGHSTRSASSTGALERTRDLPLGAVVTLAGQTWKVEHIETDVDKRGLPAWVTYATGPRMLGLITCDLTNHRSNVLVRLVPA